ncbi:hypothetical protein GCM10023097_35110 [Streptomyces collinus]
MRRPRYVSSKRSPSPAGPGPFPTAPDALGDVPDATSTGARVTENADANSPHSTRRRTVVLAACAGDCAEPTATGGTVAGAAGRAGCGCSGLPVRNACLFLALNRAVHMTHARRAPRMRDAIGPGFPLNCASTVRDAC